jgi:hypothetical protein
VRGIAYKEKIPLFYKPQENCTLDLRSSYDERTYLVYDQNLEERQMSKADFDVIKKNPQSSDYIIVPSNSKFKGSMQDECIEFIKDAELLKTESQGLINLYKTGQDVKTALNLFNHYNKSIKPEPMKQVESEWIHKASFAALIYAEKYQGEAHSYDVISHYPALMGHKLMFFPIKEGAFKMISQEEFNKLERLQYGIYRCKVEYNPSVLKQFRYNKLHYYSHIDLTVAKELKLAITMIEDQQPNQLMYDRKCLVTGHQLFKPYFDFLFELKDKNVPRAKSILNVLWGALCQKNIIKTIVNQQSSEVVEIFGDKTISKIYPKNDNEVNVEFYKNECL